MSTSIAGKKALVKVSGVGVALTAQAMTDSGDHETYAVTNPAHSVWDPQATVNVYVGGVLTGETYTLIRLTGTVKFATVNAGRGTVTTDFTYLPMSTAAVCKAFSYSLTGTQVDNTTFDSAQANAGFRSRQLALMDIQGTVTRFWSVDPYFANALLAGGVVVIEFYLDATGGSPTPDLLCWALLDKDEVKAAVEGLAEEDISFQGETDADHNVVASLS